RLQLRNGSVPIRNAGSDRDEVQNQSIGRQPSQNRGIRRQTADQLANQRIRLIQWWKQDLIPPFGLLRRRRLGRFLSGNGSDALCRRAPQKYVTGNEPEYQHAKNGEESHGRPVPGRLATRII